mgnify:CR=1 FL=1
MLSLSCILRWEIGCWGTSKVAGSANFACNKFGSLKITPWYNAIPLISFDYAFDTSLTNPNPCMIFSHIHYVHSRLQHSLGSYGCRYEGLLQKRNLYFWNQDKLVRARSIISWIKFKYKRILNWYSLGLVHACV